jgi:hypothetical protein
MSGPQLHQAATTQPLSVAGEQELRADIAKPAAADLTGQTTSEIVGPDLHDLRRQHAEYFTSSMLGQADLGPVGTVQQKVDLPNQDIVKTSAVTLGLNDQAAANVAQTQTIMLGRGYSLAAIAATSELVKHHSVAAQGTTSNQTVLGNDPQVDLAGTEPLAQGQDQAQGIDTGIAEPVAQAIPTAEAEVNVDDHMQGLADELAAYPELEAAVADKTAVQIAIADPTADPLLDHPLMAQIDEGVEIPVAAARPLSLTEGTAEPVTQPIAQDNRLDLAFVDRVAALAEELKTQPTTAVAVEEADAFVFKPQTQATAQSLDASGRLDVSLEPEATVATGLKTSEPFRINVEPGRRGRERFSTYPLAA